MNNQIICKKRPDSLAFVMFTNYGGYFTCIYFYPKSTDITMCTLDESHFQECTEEITQEEFNAELDKVYAEIKSITQPDC